jgi:regulator of sigma E protease
MILTIFFVIIFFSILILVHELGHFLAAKYFGLKVEEFGFGLPPRLFGRKIGETIYSINWLPFGGFVKIWGENKEDWEDNARDYQVGHRVVEELKGGRSFSSLSALPKAIVLASGVAMNFLLGWLLISFVLMIGIKPALLITDIQADSPAQVIGLRPGDKILRIYDGGQVLWDINEENSVEAFSKVVDQKRGQNINLAIERFGKVENFLITPRSDIMHGQGALGIIFARIGLEKEKPLLALWNGLKASIEMVYMMFLALGELFRSLVVGRTEILKEVAGPVGIIKMTILVGELGLIYVFNLLAVISLNLAVINILPFPALDGGRLLFLILEKIKGSPLPPKLERYANALGMAFLLFLMILVTIKDIFF